MTEPETLFLEPHDWVPNNPHLPALLYRRAIDGASDMAARFEKRFGGNGWPARWRDGIYPYHHYHSTAHEALGVACGSAKLTIGGPGGVQIDVVAGDVLVLPAGTGHRQIEASADFCVVGAYPAGQDFDICRHAPNEAALQRIATLPHPRADPIDGVGGALSRLWEPRDLRATNNL